MENFHRVPLALARGAQMRPYATRTRGDTDQPNDIYKHVGNDFMPPSIARTSWLWPARWTRFWMRSRTCCSTSTCSTSIRFPRRPALRHPHPQVVQGRGRRHGGFPQLQEVEELQAAGHSGLRQLRRRPTRWYVGGHPQPAREPTLYDRHARAEVVAPVRLHGELLRRLRAHRPTS